MIKVPSEPVFKEIIRKVVREEFIPVEKRLFEKMDVNFLAFEERIIGSVQKLLTDFRSDMAKLQLQVLGELQNMREDNEILKGQHARVVNHEERLEKLEKIHPRGSHEPLAA